MSHHRIAILDASHSLFDTKRLTNSADDNRKCGLQSIPHFQDILQNTVKSAESLPNLGRIAVLGVGIVCDTRTVPVSFLGKGVHNRVLARLKNNPTR
jgi:mediator of RNA polymerase II transcription subunit 14